MARRFWSVVLLLPMGFSLSTLRGLLPQGSQPSPTNLDTFKGCGIEGDATNPAVKALNRLKNRYTAPAGEINSAVTLAAIFAPGNDVSRWKVRYGAEIVGYVHDVKPGGVESVNCHARDIPHRDTHIELVLNPMESPTVRGESWDLNQVGRPRASKSSCTLASVTTCRARPAGYRSTCGIVNPE